MESTRTEKGNIDSIGVTAVGGCGSWTVEVDETLSGEEKWFLQVDGPTVYLYLQIGAPSMIQKVVSFLDEAASSVDSAGNSDAEELKIGHFSRTPVWLLRDDRAGNRCFILIGGAGESQARITLAGQDLSDFTKAVRQVRDELCNDGLLSVSN